MDRKKLIQMAVALLAAAGLAGCGTAEEADDRGSTAVGACRGHGGVAAFDDNIIICRDQTVREVEGG
jgi:putative NADH-flavin reductase